MIMPRKVQSASVRKISKAKKASRKEQEEALRLDNNRLHPPEWLDEEEQAVFNRIASEAKKINTLDNLDLEVLATFSHAYIVSKNLALRIRSSDIVLAKTDGNGNRIYYINPLVRARDTAVKQMLSCSSRLGLAATDRLKLVNTDSEAEPENKFLKFLKNG